MSKFKDYIKSEDFKCGYESHLTGWFEAEYKDKNRQGCEEHLSLNHDFSLEVERAEEELGFKLSTEQIDELELSFTKQVLDRIEFSFSDEYGIAFNWYDTTDTLALSYSDYE